ncbi:MAG: type IV secretion protein IcmT [Rhodospirillales bacterium]|nr:IcmT/TraK family protein [Alphaproteobacteria bacterium]USO03933.1 MAG: type IV secretion protein IcmT [Rhodospirillales bacterium]
MGKVEDTEEERVHWHWRNTMRPVRFFALDARAAIPFLVLLVYARPVSIFLTVVITMTFVFLERRGLSFPSALRTFRTWFLGQRRPAWLSMRRRRLIDYG